MKIRSKVFRLRPAWRDWSRALPRWIATAAIGIAATTAWGDSAITTIAGGPIVLGGSASGYLDGSASLDSQFSLPSGCAVDKDGNLLIADRNNGAVRFLDVAADTVETTVSGLLQPVDVAFDTAANLYVLTYGGGEVRKYDVFGNLLLTYGGLTKPVAMALDSSGNIYVAEEAGAVRRIAPSGSVSLLASFGSTLAGIEVLDIGWIVVADAGRNCLRVFDLTTASTWLLAGSPSGQAGFVNGTNTQTRFNRPAHLAKAPNGSIVVADQANHRIRLVATNGLTTTLMGIDPTNWVSDYPGWLDGGPKDAESRAPLGIAVSSEGTVYVTEAYYHIVREITGANLGTGFTPGGGGTGGEGEAIFVPAPLLDPASGYYPAGLQVSVFSSVPDVFYTADGTDPTTNSPRVTIVNNVGKLPWNESMRDLSALRVRAFIGTNTSAVTQGVRPQNNLLGVFRDYHAGVGATVVVPVVMNLRGGETVRSLQFRVEVSPDPANVGSRDMVSDQFRALNVTTNDFIPIVTSAQSGGASLFSVLSYTNEANARGLAVSFIGTQANMLVKDYAVVTVVAVPVPTNAKEGDRFLVRVLQPSATSDGQQTPVLVDAETESRYVVVKNLSYLVGDTVPKGWYNAGDFGNGNLNNNDVNTAFYAALGIRIPYTFSDAFDAMDVFPDDSEVSAGGDGEIRYLDWQRLLRRSLRLPGVSTNNWSRTWTDGGVRVASRTNLNERASSVAALYPNTLRKAIWQRQALIRASAAGQVQPGQMVHLPVSCKVAAGSTLSGLLFTAVVTPVGAAPELLKPVGFRPAPGIPSGTSASLDLNRVGYGWDIGAFNPPLQGTTLLGYLEVYVPVAAAANDQYAVSFSRADGAPDLNTQYDLESLHGGIWVGVPAPTPADAISDEWKLAFFGSVAAVDAAADVDADRDGTSNWAEFVAGTNPADATSRLEVRVGPATQNSVAGMLVRWQSMPGKRYLIESSAALLGGAWKPLGSERIGDGSIMEVFDGNPGGGQRYYRVRLLEE